MKILVTGAAGLSLNRLRIKIKKAINQRMKIRNYSEEALKMTLFLFKDVIILFIRNNICKLN